MTDDIDEIVRRLRVRPFGNAADGTLYRAADALERLKARAEAAENRLNGCRQWLRANANAERSSEARAAFIEAHNAILAIIEDRK